MSDRPTDLTDVSERLAEAAARRGEWDQAEALAGVVSVLAADYPAEAREPGRGAVAGALAEVAEIFGLDQLDSALLLCACAPGLDANVGLAYGLLRGLAGVAEVSVGLALELAGVGTAEAAAFDRLGTDAPLRRHRLVEVVGTDPWPARTLRPADPVVAALSGATPSDPVVTPMRSTATPLALPGGAGVMRAIEHGVGLTWVHSGPRAAGGSLAAGALANLGLDWLAVDARRLPAGQDLAEAMACATRLAGLLGRALIVLGGEALGEDPAAARSCAVLADARVPVIVSGRCTWNSEWLQSTPFVIEAEPLSVFEREAVWAYSGLGELVEHDPALRQTLRSLRMTAEDVEETVRYARIIAAARGDEVDAAAVTAAVRQVAGGRGDRGARVDVAVRAGGGPTFDDLVLPEHVLASLRQLVSWGRHRDEIQAHGPLRRGRGIAALFAGNPGTGKTLAAHVIAEALSVDLYQVDLSAIVDKYIGETEKNLEKVFEAAEALDVVLFFDEADALFGSRSEVRDARDRYANQEIAYLLQRMERFEGVTILATNLRGNLDRAFSRRMSFIVNFPDPDVPTRARLWDRHLAALPLTDPGDPVDVDYLAQEAELAGGDIRNIVLAAAYDAVSEGVPVGMRHVRAATLNEFRKLGRVIPEHAFTTAPG